MARCREACAQSASPVVDRCLTSKPGPDPIARLGGEMQSQLGATPKGVVCSARPLFSAHEIQLGLVHSGSDLGAQVAQLSGRAQDLLDTSSVRTTQSAQQR